MNGPNRIKTHGIHLAANELMSAQQAHREIHVAATRIQFTLNVNVCNTDWLACIRMRSARTCAQVYCIYCDLKGFVRLSVVLLRPSHLRSRFGSV